MASKYTFKAIFNKFGLSDSELNNKDSKDIYGYVGEPVLRRTDVQDLGESIVAGHLVNREEGTDNLLQVNRMSVI